MSWRKIVFIPRPFRRSPTSRTSPPSRFRPSVQVLEDRTVPSGSDLFADATLLEGNTVAVTGSNVDATGEPGEPDHADSSVPLNSVWWQWTAPADGRVFIDTLGSDFNTTLAAYTGDAVDNLTPWAGNDDISNDPENPIFQSKFDFEVLGGTTYYIAVDGFQDQTGAIVLNLAFTPPNHPPQIDSQSFAVNENSAAGVEVGTVLASDPDQGQTLTYAITDGNESGAFAIDGSTGLITVANPAVQDYETTPSFTLTVLVTDSDSPGLSQSAAVTINLNDVNEPVVFVATGPFAVDENSPGGTAVGTVTATDQDIGQTLFFSIIDGNASGVFAIDGSTGAITVADAAALDFETASSFTLTVRVTDSGTPALSATASVRVNVNDVNEAPTFAATGPFAVDENSPAETAVGTVTATDPDAGDTLSYAIAGGDPAGAFAIDAATGAITVANAVALNFEVTPSFTLTVTVTDSGFLSATTIVTVRLRDLNDAPVLDNRGSMSLAAIDQGDANNPGTLVSDILASAGGNPITDEDAGALTGIAVIGADTAHGTWQFSTDGGATWSALGAVSDSSARLLVADAGTRVRFVPAAGFNGTVADGITFRAWDQTSGANGGLGDASVTGGSSAFSVAFATASIEVRPVDSVAEQFQVLEAEVHSLVTQGDLTPFQGFILDFPLQLAKREYDQGDTESAVVHLRVFTLLVNVYEHLGLLTGTQAQSLVTKANALIAAIGG